MVRSGKILSRQRGECPSMMPVRIVLRSGKPVFLFIASASAGALLVAAIFQLVLDLPPCSLCLWQRWPYSIAFLISLLSLASAPRQTWQRKIFFLLSFFFLANTALGLYHVGLQSRWWDLYPISCTTMAYTPTHANQLFDMIDTARAPHSCLTPQWQFLGISLPGYSAFLSFILASLSCAAAMTIPDHGKTHKEVH